jgi:hypothetical protein
MSPKSFPVMHSDHVAQSPASTEEFLNSVPNRPSFSYFIYGLSLRSQWELPCTEHPETGQAAIDLVEGSPALFREAARKAAHLPLDKEWLHYTRLADGWSYLRRPRLFEFLISPDGRRIFGRRAGAGIPEESFHAYLLGAALSFSLIQLVFDPLHATAVAADGSAFGFLGRSGDGKSTLAGAFLQTGYPIVTDDLLVLKKDPEGFSAYPGFPRIKLYPKAARFFIDGQVEGTRMNPFTHKLVIPLKHQQTHQTVVPLKTLYVLHHPSPGAGDGRITIRRLSPRRALLALLKHCFNDWVNEPARLSHMLQLYSEIASRVPVKRISYPRRMAELGAVRDAILKDIQSLNPSR